MASFFLVCISIVLLFPGLLFLFKPDIVANFENDHTPWGKQFSTPQQRELSFWRLFRLRFFGTSMTAGGLLPLCIIFGAFKRNPDPTAYEAPPIVVFIFIFSFVVVGALLILRPDIWAELENNNSLYYKTLASAEERELTFERLLRIRIGGVIMIGIVVFFFLTVSGVIQ